MQTNIKEFPIPFSGEMVRAILRQDKTQTRRPIKKVKGYRHVTEFQMSRTPGYDYCFRRPDMVWCDYRRDDLLKLCPYGQPGERLWVRESWGYWPGSTGLGPIEEGGAPPIYRADGSDDLPEGYKWRPSIHMPRIASRILLEITEVGIEQVQSISEEDALAEGVNELICPQCGCGDQISHGASIRTRCSSSGCGLDYLSAVEGFKALWQSTYSGSWERNDWNWVIKFKLLEGLQHGQ
jgi:hypothetical protein